MSESELTELFRKLGAEEPESWARSQLGEGIPQLARFLFLRQAWRCVVPEGDLAWMNREIEHGLERPNAPFAGVGQALERLRAQGANPNDVADVVRGMQAQLLSNLCYLLDDPGDVESEVQHVGWTLVQCDDAGNVVGVVGGLHESILETDPTGREMRPRPKDGDVG